MTRRLTGDNASESDIESDIVDVSGVDLAQLEAMPDSVLADALRHVLAEDDGTPHQYAAFQNAF